MILDFIQSGMLSWPHLMLNQATIYAQRSAKHIKAVEVTMTQQSSTIARVTDWLLAKKPDLQVIDLDMDLIENRIIDSLSFMDFVFFSRS
jgi:hypothetical protein